jgi:CMP-N-acetylneuraminic acid synthetase
VKVFTIIKEESKRIPGKNFIDINGHPLWWYLLSELEGLHVTVNTDSQKFINQLYSSQLRSIRVINRLQKHIDWENDENLGSSPVEDMLFEFCETIDRSEIVVLTHVTSPFLKKETIFDAVDMLQNDHKSKSIHSVHQVQDFVWLKRANEVSPVNFFTDRVQRTQDLSPILVSKGAFFIARAGDILDQRNRLPEPLLFFPLDHMQAVEIDNFEDLKFARLLSALY